MIEFCSQCAIEIFGDDNRELAGLCGEGYMAAVLCEGCGMIWVDHTGKCQTKCDKHHYDDLMETQESRGSSVDGNPTSRDPRELDQNPTSDS